MKILKKEVRFCRSSLFVLSSFSVKKNVEILFKKKNFCADLGIPFKAHGPIKTSSPIEYNTSERIAEKPNKEEEDHGVTPILFNSEDEAEEPQAEPVPDPKPLCNGQVTEEYELFFFCCYFSDRHMIDMN